jgi:hypothetical protein
MAFVLPIFILAIIGILEFGRVIMLQQILVNAAREGGRRAIVPGATTEEVETLVKDYLAAAGLGTGEDRKVAVWDDEGNNLELEDVDAGSHPRVQVIVQVPYDGFTSYFNDSKMRARVQMRKE